MPNPRILPAVAASISVAALIISLAAMNYVPHISASTNLASSQNSYQPVVKDFWIFNDKVNGMNDSMVGLPGDHFSISTIVANKGDTVNIHFYNVEEKGGDSHSFTIYDKPYDNINVTVKPGTNQTITFTATTVGVYTYLCTFHQPSMRGQLVVLEPPEET